MNQFKKKFLKVPHLSLMEAIREEGNNPFVDWIIILLVTCIFIIVFVGGGVSLYQEVISGEIQDTNDIPNVSKVVSFNKKDVSSLIDVFNHKDLILTQIKNKKIDIADPSLF